MIIVRLLQGDSPKTAPLSVTEFFLSYHVKVLVVKLDQKKNQN